MTPDAYADVFYTLARHLPGLGGSEGLDSLTGDQVTRVAKRLEHDMRREAAAIRSASKR